VNTEMRIGQKKAMISRYINVKKP